MINKTHNEDCLDTMARMEDKIKKILEEYKVYGDKQDLITEELLVLFNVSQRREMLQAYHKHLYSFNDPTIYNASESMIDDYLANNCC